MFGICYTLHFQALLKRQNMLVNRTWHLAQHVELDPQATRYTKPPSKHATQLLVGPSAMHKSGRCDEGDIALVPLLSSLVSVCLTVVP